MLTIRLSRTGKKNKPMYKLVISEKSKDPYGKALEILGSYNPHSKELQAKADRINYWIGQGAGMSASVNNLLVEKEIIKGEKVKASQAKPAKKAKKEPEQAKAEGGDKTEQKNEEAKPEEKPVEEAPQAEEEKSEEEK
jgi:small subunit ribosomal protein S16